MPKKKRVIKMPKERPSVESTGFLNDLEECIELLAQVNDYLGKYPELRKQSKKVSKLGLKLRYKQKHYLG